MSERWKPNNGEKYFYVNLQYGGHRRDTWLNTDLDENRWENGDCFKTKEEAEYAASKVKDLLLSLHHGVATKFLAKAGLADAYCALELSRAFVKRFANNNELQASIQDKPLPKLTEEVFDSPDCPEWANYAVVDSLGNGYFYKSTPICSEEGWHCIPFEFVQRIGKFDTTDWQNSLVERPAKLSDWCTVGAWVYEKERKEYFEITKVDYLISIRNADGKGQYGPGAFKDKCVPARLRPYNAEEMKALVGKVIKKGPSMHFVTGFENVFDNEYMVHVNGCLYGANYLLRQFTIDNTPCGVLEHLENGEWVR